MDELHILFQMLRGSLSTVFPSIFVFLNYTSVANVTCTFWSQGSPTGTKRL